jgi:integral membrane protein (TIGR00529 family)
MKLKKEIKMVIITLIISMAVTLFLVSKKVNIGYSLMTGAVILSLLNGRSFAYILNVFLRTFSESTTITLALTIALITVLGHLMEKYLILDRMITALEQMLRSAKATILIAPAIIGTLLVTGGALMSCPVVDNLGNKLDIPNDRRASINLIFRHALYFFFPLSPTIILAAEIGDYNLLDFIKLQFPIAVAMYIFGYIFYLKKYPHPRLEKIEARQYIIAISQFTLYSSPILVSLCGVLLFDLPFYISLVFGILLSITINIYDKSKDGKYDINENVFKTIYEGVKPAMVIAIIGIMIFKNVVNDFDALFIFLNSLLNKGIPIELLIIISCAIISFPLASIQPSIAILYPMILPLAPNPHVKLLYAMFIYISGFMFYYISPLHMCQVLTLEYFDVKIKDLYRNYVYILPLTYLVMLAIYIMNIL